MCKEIVRKSDGKIMWTLGNFMDCGTEYVVYNGGDYISYPKDEYDLIKVEGD